MNQFLFQNVYHNTFFHFLALFNSLHKADQNLTKKQQKKKLFVTKYIF